MSGVTIPRWVLDEINPDVITPKKYLSPSEKGMITKALEIVKYYETSGIVTAQDRYNDSFLCKECGTMGQHNFDYERSWINGEVWECNCCYTEIATPHSPTENKT